MNTYAAVLANLGSLATQKDVGLTPAFKVLCGVIDAHVANLRDELTPPEPVKLESTSDPRFNCEG